jgi:kumamolisin
MRRIAGSYLPPPRARFIAPLDEDRPIRLLAVLKSGAAGDRLADLALRRRLAATAVDATGTSLMLRGRLRDMRQLFRAEGLGIYDDGRRRFIARGGYVEAAAALAPKVVAAMGFDGRRQAKPASAGPIWTGVAPTPREIARFYDLPGWLDGSGQTVGVIALGGGYDEAALDAYFAQTGIRRSGRIFAASVDGTVNEPTPTGDPDGDAARLEVQMDIRIIGSIAPAADIVVYFAAPGGLANLAHALQAAIADRQYKPSVIAASWHFPESAASDAALAALEDMLAAAKDEVTLCAASGDRGGQEDPDASRPVVSTPASCSYALACGGTTLTAAGGEAAWGDGAQSSGGGYSRRPQPAYQAGVVPDRRYRGVPDVAGFADPGYGAAIGDPAPYGGTSVAAPLWAAFIALINQQRGRPAGFANARLYGGRAAFNDITGGGNADFQAGPGWDPLTGLGSPRGTEILSLF